MPFYLKCRFCLFPKANYIHLDTFFFFLSFTSLMTNIFIFRFFEPFSLNYDQNTLGYCFTESWSCQKIMPFLPKMPILLRPYKLKTYIYTFKIEIFSRPYFTNLMTGVFHFLIFWTLFLLKYDQNTLGYNCFSEQWCCQKKHVFLLKMPILLRP